MKKLGMYSLLVAAALLTGCSEKAAEIDTAKDTKAQAETTAKAETNSESNLNTIPDVKEEVLNGEYSVVERTDSGTSYVVNGDQDVFISNVYFRFDRYDLTSKQKDVAVSNAEKLQTMNNTGVKISGNTDEWGSDEYNYALGLKRAKTVKDILVNEGVDASSISLISLGESNPVCTEKNSTCWQKNRRVEHTLIK